MRNTMVKSVFRYLYFLRRYKHVQVPCLPLHKVLNVDPFCTKHLCSRFLSGLWTIGWIDCTDDWHRRGPHWAPYVTVSMEPVNACNFLRNKDIWKRTSPLCSSSNSSPKTCITLPPSHLKCSTGIQYGRLQNGGRQGHPHLMTSPSA